MATLIAIEGQGTQQLDPIKLQQKQDKLLELLSEYGDVLVAYSGGTDSAYLAWAAHQALGERAIAITADSASMPTSHKKDAAEFARQFGIRHEMIPTFEFENPKYIANDKDRCFHCKDELFTRMEAIGRERGFEHIVYGVNVDDLGDYRPGQNAAQQHNVKAPMADAGLSKAEIRELSRLAGLPTWDRPAAACLSSRVPYGTQVTEDVIRVIEDGEEALKALGLRQMRVRYHGELARIEVAREEMPKLFDLRVADQVVEIFKALGFQYVTLDLQGYRQGSLNEVLNLDTTAAKA